MTYSVLVVDDHPMILEGVTSLLETMADLRIVGVCADGKEALEALEAQRPDLMVLDLQMEGMGGLEVLRQLPAVSPSTRTLLLTASLTKREVLEAVRLGAHGIILKDEASDKLLSGIRKVLGGEKAINAQLLQDALDAAVQTMRAGTEADRLRALLTERETEVAKLVASGNSNKKIARELDITEGTVKLHLHKIFQKLDVPNRVRLTLLVNELFED